jgi:hypothetical protein
MEQVQLTTREALLYGALFTAAIGFAVGLVPLAIGIWKKNLKLGVLGLLASTIGGALLGLLLAVPAAAIFVWLIVKRPKDTTAEVREEVNDTSTVDNP